MKSIFLFLVSIILGIYLSLCLAFYLFQEKLIFHPVRLPADFKFTFPNPFEEVMISTPDGENINALHFKVEDPRGVVLYFHGNAGNLAAWGEIAHQFSPYNYDLFIIDYRGFGKSTGKISEKNLYQDAQSSYQFLLKAGYLPQDIIIYGRSIGTGIASNLAKEVDHSALILESPFSSMTSLARYYGPFLPHRWLLKYKFPVDDNIAALDSPVFILHGKEDEIIPFHFAEQLRRANPAVVFYSFEDVGHNDLSTHPDFFPVLKEVLFF